MRFFSLLDWNFKEGKFIFVLTSVVAFKPGLQIFDLGFFSHHFTTVGIHSGFEFADIPGKEERDKIKITFQSFFFHFSGNEKNYFCETIYEIL